MIKRFTCFALCVIFCVGGVISVFGNTRLKDDGDAVVIDVYDGDAIKIKMLTGDNAGDVALVRLAGVNAQGYDGAFSYTQNMLLGETVYVTFGGAPFYVNGSWNYMNVYLNGGLVSASLVKSGLAEVVSGYPGVHYATLYDYEKEAVASGLGIYDTRTLYKNAYPVSTPGSQGKNIIPYTGEFVNINTAPYSIMLERFPEIPPSVILSVIAYRAVNPFSEPGQIKHVPGFTPELYNLYRGGMTVSTNINKATAGELITLGITPYEAEKIEKATFTNVSQLVSLAFITSTTYDTIAAFVDTADRTRIRVSVPSTVLNLSDADVSDLTGLGLSNTAADAIITATGDYTNKTLGELMYIWGANLSPYTIYSLADNLTLSSGEYININLASPAQLATLGLTNEEASRISLRKRFMFTYADIPVDISRVDSQITLYTNINTASLIELDSLGISPDVRNAIIRCRNSSPIGSYDELRDVMQSAETSGEYNTFNDIWRFITFL